ncbi:MAG: hypothetical protein FWC38_09105 [Proteobacteria bacterium]|nr:hypothetical protein [Pseudomonadota bacterium]MCL2308357.1 hypothetical protein [Pseudomonadota bacterium]
MGEEPLLKVARLPWRAGLLWWWQALVILNGAKLKWWVVGLLYLIFFSVESKIIRWAWVEIALDTTWAIDLAQRLLSPFLMSLVAVMIWAQMFSPEAYYRMWIRKIFLAHGRTLLTIGGVYCSIIFALDMFCWGMEWAIPEESVLRTWLSINFFLAEAAKVFFLLASMEILFQHTAIKTSLCRTWLGVKNNWAALATTNLGVVLFFMALTKVQTSGLIEKTDSEILIILYTLWGTFVGGIVWPFFLAWTAVMFFVMYRGIFHSEASR